MTVCVCQNLWNCTLKSENVPVCNLYPDKTKQIIIANIALHTTCQALFEVLHIY